MPRSPSDRDPRRPRSRAVALAWLLTSLAVPAGIAAQFAGELIIEDWSRLDYNSRDGSMTLEDVLITHGGDTRIEASHAHRVQRPGRVNQLDLSGGVHIRFRDATLDAESAQMMFRGEELVSVEVKGSQAQFSHQPAGYPRRVSGSADAIGFDAGSGRVRFAGNTSYTDGRYSLSSDVVVYDIDDGTVVDDGDAGSRGRAVIPLNIDDDERLPAPRTPDRSTAQ